MGPVEGSQVALRALSFVGLIYLAIELRRIRALIRSSDASQREHREAMIRFAADVLRTALDGGKGRVLVVEPKKANDNAGAGGEEGGADVMPFQKDRPPDPSKK